MVRTLHVESVCGSTMPYHEDRFCTMLTSDNSFKRSTNSELSLIPEKKREQGEMILKHSFL